MRWHSKILMFLVGIRLKVSNLEILTSQKPPFLICANHSSFIDIPTAYCLIPFYYIFTGKKEIEKWPLFRIFYTSGMNILVDRHKENGDIKAFRRMLGVIDDGLPLWVFPEGTISKTAPVMTDFKQGALSIAIKKQIPIVPVTFVTNWRRLQRKGFFAGKASPGVSRVVVHPPIQTTGLKSSDGEELASRLKEQINVPLLEAMKQ